MKSLISKAEANYLLGKDLLGKGMSKEEYKAYLVWQSTPVEEVNRLVHYYYYSN